MPTKKFKALKELLEDSKQCTRLTERDEDFLASTRARVAQFAERTFFSEKQEEWLKDLERKVYAT
jgi:hypothetical protein